MSSTQLLPLDDGHYVYISAQADPVQILCAYILLKEQYKITGIRWNPQGVGMLDVPAHVYAGETPYVVVDAHHPSCPPYGVFDVIILQIWRVCFRFKRIKCWRAVRDWYVEQMRAVQL